MQGLNLYPTGYQGISQHYFEQTNIVPIADGWCFYSPAYKAALKARHITNPYVEILKENTYIVTQNNTDEQWALNIVSAIHKNKSAPICNSAKLNPWALSRSGRQLPRHNQAMELVWTDSFLRLMTV